MREILPGLRVIDEIGDNVHCYLWEWRGGITLIDAGHPRDATTILQTLRQHGYADHSIRRIIATHVDIDHTGGVAHLKQVTGARVACHAVEKPYLEAPWKRQAAFWPLRPMIWFMTRMPQFRYIPVTPDELLVDGQVLPEGFTVIHTPGHSPGHISLLHKGKRFLICGDALVNTRNRLHINTGLFTTDKENAQRSAWKLAKKYGDDFEVMVFGHGPPILQNGGKRVKALVSRIYSEDV
ncbi:MAG: MBL fold metallo-hydrolase [Caldilineaceae bacterium]|nr:MBL fold metallo-hydrolase [Caldilineaceae bacterium]